jgi:hypothetical protein
MKLIVFIAIFVLSYMPVLANSELDSDFDAVPDKDELNIYKTNHLSKDTDGDGYSDFEELTSGYSPLNPKKVMLEDNDFDEDGLSDKMELNFHTDLTNYDTDGDGYSDGDEIKSGYDPLNSEKIKLAKKIEINTKNQKLSYYLKDVKIGEYPVSSGKNNSTPRGAYKIINKHPKAWSPFGLWMPYWLGLGTGKFGIHELPIWPNGYREGANHLGIPVSHGCIRLGIGPAKIIYDWVEVGTPVVIN